MDADVNPSRQMTPWSVWSREYEAASPTNPKPYSRREPNGLRVNRYQCGVSRKRKKKAAGTRAELPIIPQMPKLRHAGTAIYFTGQMLRTKGGSRLHYYIQVLCFQGQLTEENRAEHIVATKLGLSPGSLSRIRQFRRSSHP